jgi:DNA-binding response OmpR family regulator
MVKPFSPRELVARIRAVLRRGATKTAGAGETYEAGGLKVDVQMMRATLEEKTLDLTPTEFQLLTAFVRQPGRVFTRSQLLDAVHGVAFESYERAIDAHIKNLRKKIEPSPAEPQFILTVHGVGYRLNDV